MATQTWTKMSKSKGNTISPDEVVYGVYQLSPEYEFRNELNQVVDHTKIKIVRIVDYNYYTAKRFGSQPVFLCLKGEVLPPLIDGRVQHEDA